jgi:FkbM family methyltransferase
VKVNIDKVRRRVAHWITPEDSDVIRRLKAYYVQQPSCQIPDLWYLLEVFFGANHVGDFVEVGAFDGVFASNTWGLAESGWNGLYVEAVPEFAEKCRENHSNHPKICVVESAVASPGTTEIDLYLAGTLTTSSAGMIDSYRSLDWAKSSDRGRTIRVKANTLDDICSMNSVPANFEVLVIDVEGAEEEVLSGFSLDKWKPKMIIIELCDSHPDFPEFASADAKIQREIISHGYVVAFKDRINAVFVDAAWHEVRLQRLRS